MKLPILVFAIGAVFLAGCVAFFVFSNGNREEEAPALKIESVSTTTVPEPSTIAFTEEGRQPSVPANADMSAPECDRGVADRIADEERMRMGEISAYTKEAVIQAITRRTELFKTASAACIRTYIRTGMANDGGDWTEFMAMSDERLVTMARFIAVMSMEDGETPQEFRARMLGNEAAWMYKGPEMKVGFEEKVQNGTVTTYQSASLSGGYWY